MVRQRGGRVIRAASQSAPNHRAQPQNRRSVQNLVTDWAHYLNLVPANPQQVVLAHPLVPRQPADQRGAHGHGPAPDGQAQPHPQQEQVANAPAPGQPEPQVEQGGDQHPHGAGQPVQQPRHAQQGSQGAGQPPHGADQPVDVLVEEERFLLLDRIRPVVPPPNCIPPYNIRKLLPSPSSTKIGMSYP